MRLLSPFRLGRIDLPSRVVMAPLTRRRAGEGKVPTALMAQHYAQRAGAGLIVTESTEIDPRSDPAAPTRPGLIDRAQRDGWRRVVESVHDAGGRVFVQLSHLGRAAHPLMLADGGLPVGPSAIAAAGNAFTAQGLRPFPVPRALELEEVPNIVAQFAQAARHALAAGFDGVEIHGANGYLIDQFLRSGANRRRDDYGGPPERRARLLLEVTEAVATIWGSDRVGVRLSPWSGFNGMSDEDPVATFVKAAAMLDRIGIAYLHLIEPVDTASPVAPLLRGVFGGALILAGGFDRESAEAAIERGDADLIAFGEKFIANPDLPERFRHGRALNVARRDTFYSGGAAGYVDYPALQDEPA